jgi:large subunit ribosomal protein L10
LPTDKKRELVAEIRKLLEGSTVAISADYTGMGVTDMTALRRALRETNVEFRVVKNRLTYLAADQAGKPLVKEIVEGPTGIAFGFDDPVAPAKAMVEYIRVSRSPLKIRGAVVGDRQLTPEEVSALALLPSRDELIARLMAQLQSPITRLAGALNAPLAGLVTVLHRASESGSEAPAEA